MNERIKELAEQAGMGPMGIAFSSEIMQKFAELIVLECANFVDQNTLENQGMWGKIMRHFGVIEE